MKTNELVIILDFGSPYNQMLTRKIRQLGVYSELISNKISAEKIKQMNTKTIILSGGTHYINDENKYRPDDAIFSLGIPILGICYGMQVIIDKYGGKVEKAAERTYDSEQVKVIHSSPLLKGSGKTEEVFMSYGYDFTQ